MFIFGWTIPLSSQFEKKKIYIYSAVGLKMQQLHAAGIPALHPLLSTAVGIQPNRLGCDWHYANEVLLRQTAAHLSGCPWVEGKVWQRLSGLRLLLSNPSFCSALYPICRTDAAPAADLRGTSLAKNEKDRERDREAGRTLLSAQVTKEK